MLNSWEVRLGWVWAGVESGVRAPADAGRAEFSLSGDQPALHCLIVQSGMQQSDPERGQWSVVKVQN